jgi:PAS domain S-box-containing protein
VFPWLELNHEKVRLVEIVDNEKHTRTLKVTMKGHQLGGNICTSIILRDVTEAAVLEKELIELKTMEIKYRHALECLSDGVIITDNKGKIIYINKAQERIDNVTKSYVHNKNAKEFFNLDDESSVLMQALITKKDIPEQHQYYINMVGQAVNIVTYGYPLRVDDKVIGAVAVCRDTTKVKDFAGVADGNTIWEQASAIFGGEWQFDGEEKIRIGGDGAAWVKEGTDVFPGATYHLELFHLRKRLTEALGFNKNYYQTVAEKLYEIDLDGLKEAFGSILKKTKGEAKRKKVANLQKYILNNWEGISNLPKEDRLGVIEGQVRHTIARRMKGIGGGWSSTGTDHMARLLAAKANNELVKYSGVSDGYKRDQIASVLPKTLVDPRSKSSKKDTNEWLAAAMPVLEGPSSGKTWVKYVLRQLTSVRIA